MNCHNWNLYIENDDRSWQMDIEDKEDSIVISMKRKWDCPSSSIILSSLSVWIELSGIDKSFFYWYTAN